MSWDSHGHGCTRLSVDRVGLNHGSGLATCGIDDFNQVSNNDTQDIATAGHGVDVHGPPYAGECLRITFRFSNVTKPVLASECSSALGAR